MTLVGDNPTTDSSVLAIKNNVNDDDSDVELEGMDLEGDDGEVDDNADVDMDPVNTANHVHDEDDKEVIDKLATEDQDELEAAHRAR